MWQNEKNALQNHSWKSFNSLLTIWTRRPTQSCLHGCLSRWGYYQRSCSKDLRLIHGNTLWNSTTRWKFTSNITAIIIPAHLRLKFAQDFQNVAKGIFALSQWTWITTEQFRNYVNVCSQRKSYIHGPKYDEVSWKKLYWLHLVSCCSWNRNQIGISRIPNNRVLIMALKLRWTSSNNAAHLL